MENQFGDWGDLVEQETVETGESGGEGGGQGQGEGEGQGEGQGKGEGQGQGEDQGKGESQGQGEGKGQFDDDDEFDSNSFVESFKKDNPEASEEEIEEATKKAEEDFYKIKPDFLKDEFGSSSDKPNPQKEIINYLKDIAGDDFDEVSAASVESADDVKSLVNNIVEKRVEKIKSEQGLINEKFESMDDSEKALFNIYKERGLKGVSEYLQPDQQIAKVMNLNDEDLIIQSLKNSKDAEGNPLYSEEEITKKLGNMEDEEIVKQATVLRGQLAKIAQQRRNAKAQEINENWKKKQNQEVSQRQEMAQKIKAVGSKTENFYGLPIDEQLSEAVASEYAKGNFDHLKNDPKFWFESILARKFMKRAFKRHGKAKFEEGLRKKNESDHNADLPDRSTGGGSSSGSGGQGSGWWDQ